MQNSKMIAASKTFQTDYFQRPKKERAKAVDSYTSLRVSEHNQGSD